MKALRWICLIEGISCLLLFFVAMPMKYLGDDASLVPPVGRVHGFLWVIMLFGLFQAMQNNKLNTKEFLLYLIVGSAPLGMFWLDGQIRHKEVNEE